jgi:hypothetical protein
MSCGYQVVPAKEADPMMRHIFGALMLIGALGSTAFVPTAQAATRDRRAPVARFYDRGQRGDQPWNASENRAYRGDLSNGHRPYRTFSRLHRNQPQDYRGWRRGGR